MQNIVLPLFCAVTALLLVKFLSDTKSGKLTLKFRSLNINIPFGFVSQWVLIYAVLYFSVIGLEYSLFSF